MRKSEFYNEAIGQTLTRYHSARGTISLAPPSFITMGQYEIYCLEGRLFEDIERYQTLDEAEARIKELLGDDNDKTDVSDQVPDG